MKKLLTVAAVLVSAGMFAGVGEDNPTSASGVAVMRKDGNKFHLIYKAESTTNVKVSIFNAKNRLVYSETLKDVDGFLRPYDFSELPEGEYTISISDGSTKKVEKVDYRAGKVSKLVNVLKVGGAENKFLVTAVGKGKEYLTVNIFDRNDRLLHTEARLTTGDFAQVYKIANVSGPLTFEVIHENGEAKKIQY